MAIYRTVYMNFWRDTKIIDDFTPEDRYFMLYCLTNDYTNLCGCFEISIKQMALDTGYNTETIEKLLLRFEKIHKIIFYNKQNKEMLIKNWYKYNWTRSEKLDKPLLKEIENIKTSDFKAVVVENYNKRDTVSIPYVYPIDTSDADTDTVTDTVNITAVELQKLFIKCTGSTNLNALEECISYLKDFSYEVIEIALKKASEKNGGWKYAKRILQNWLSSGIRTIEQVQTEEVYFKNKTTNTTKKMVNYGNYPQRNYTTTDFDKFYANKGGENNEN